MLPTLAFVLVTGFTLNNGAISTIVIPGLADENECHKLALKLNTPKHGCRGAAHRCSRRRSRRTARQRHHQVKRQAWSAKSIRSSLNRSVATPVPFRTP
jgi:hypothetical protein